MVQSYPTTELELCYLKLFCVVWMNEIRDFTRTFSCALTEVFPQLTEEKSLSLLWNPKEFTVMICRNRYHKFRTGDFPNCFVWLYLFMLVEPLHVQMDHASWSLAFRIIDFWGEGKYSLMVYSQGFLTLHYRINLSVVIWWVRGILLPHLSCSWTGVITLLKWLLHS